MILWEDCVLLAAFTILPTLRTTLTSFKRRKRISTRWSIRYSSQNLIWNFRRKRTLWKSQSVWKNSITFSKKSCCYFKARLTSILWIQSKLRCLVESCSETSSRCPLKIRWTSLWPSLRWRMSMSSFSSRNCWYCNDSLCRWTWRHSKLLLVTKPKNRVRITVLRLHKEYLLP